MARRGRHRHATCPSSACTVVLSGLTSVIDIEFGPAGFLYVLEYDENGWFGATSLGNAAGGTVNKCDVFSTGTCSPIETGITLPGDMSFAASGKLWLLENDLGVGPGGAPTVRGVSLP